MESDPSSELHRHPNASRHRDWYAHQFTNDGCSEQRGDINFYASERRCLPSRRGGYGDANARSPNHPADAGARTVVP